MEKKRKIIVGVSVAVGLLVLGGGMLGFHNYSVKAEEQEQIRISKEKSEIKDLQTQIDKYFTNDKKEDIVASVNKEDMQQLVNKSKELPKSYDVTKELERLSTDLLDLQTMTYAQNKVNALFDTQNALIPSANIKFAESEVNRLKTKKPVFVKNQLKKIDEAKNQKKIIEEATTKVNNLFTTEQKTEVKKEVTKTSYNQAKEAVNKIKQQQAKEDLLKNLNTVNKSLTEKEKKEQQAATEKAVQNETSKPSESSNSNEGNSSSNKNVGGNSSSSNSSDKNNASNGSNAKKSTNGGSSNKSSSAGSGSKSSSNGGSNKASSGSSSGGKSSSNGGSNKASDGSSGSKSSGGSKKPSGDINPGKPDKVKENENGGTDEYFGW
ncbi:hypothetical protein IBB71_14130 [Listeria welshimeri]|uniref:toxin Cry1Ac domain D-VI-related protein n=1 Tax=Listeria welshimeri TaxID=1643 RepID=UPI0016237055|nr:toxin Cry1Ac domain D-VI-related protein [Listeria welshimeri]MBC1982281.1 hypothetical protein [Listeria welshimeri]MBC2011198.1 hypothetical protein [Listeria welshimeri]MBF2659620.1 hypothetical protein [Listeria welshimeri]